MTLPSKSQEAYFRQTSPLILLGMHRSGTSLMVRLLVDLGIYMGGRRSRDDEAVFFQLLNRKIYSAAGSNWAEACGLLEAMDSPQFIEKHTRLTSKDLYPSWNVLGRDRGIANFFGPELWQAVCQQDRLVWGWKDPRTTLTFPIWLNIFPNARWVHLIRNGVDVAISLHRRSLKQSRKFRNKLLRFDYQPATLDFNYSFHLWETYIGFVMKNKAIIPPENYLEIRYEDLLAQPEAQLRKIARFMGLPIEAEALSAACRQINRKRLDNSRAANPYFAYISALGPSPMMQQLGYPYVISK